MASCDSCDKEFENEDEITPVTIVFKFGSAVFSKVFTLCDDCVEDFLVMKDDILENPEMFMYGKLS